MKREQVLNTSFAAVGTAVLAVIGWLALSVIQLQTHNAAENAEKQLRDDITDIMNDVDKRLAIIEALIRREPHIIVSEAANTLPEPLAPDPANDDQSAWESMSTQHIPRYDLRDHKNLNNAQNTQNNK